MNRFIVMCGVVASLFIAGCTESEKEAQTGVEKPAPPLVQETIPDQQTASIPERQESMETGPLSDTAPEQAAVQNHLTLAGQAVNKAEELLKQAPTGKGSDLAIAALNQKVNSAQNLLQTGQTHFQDQQYSLAKQEAQEAENQANTVIQQVEQALGAVKAHSP